MSLLLVFSTILLICGKSIDNSELADGSHSFGYYLCDDVYTDSATASMIVNIKSCSKKKLISFLSSINKTDIQHLLITFLKQHQSQSTPIIDQIYDNPSKENINRSINAIRDNFINTTNNESQNAQNNPFVLLPSSIVAYIISFNTMHDRLKYKSICKCFYTFCDIPIAKYHLCIDHNLVEAINNNVINHSDFTHTNYIHLKYVFRNSAQSSGKYGDLQSKYYSFITQILSKSPSLNTINYHLERRKSKNNLNAKSYEDRGHLLQWLHSLQRNNNSMIDIFNSVHNLISTYMVINRLFMNQDIMR